MATAYSADEPDRLRGPQHDCGWADELAAWKYAQDAWDMFITAPATPDPTLSGFYVTLASAA